MSSFNCEKCGTSILENEQGYYYTACEHYPLELNNKNTYNYFKAWYEKNNKV